MLNKLLTFIRSYDMLQPGDRVVCAVSGGADSVALLFALYLLAPKLQIELSAAHFNHRLRGSESDRDEAFVKDFCAGYDIPFYSGSGEVVAGEKGLEAAAREARYAYLRSLPGKIATAHTADDNLETVLMHLVRGTGLKGLGGIAPVNERLIRPMLCVNREQVLAFLEEYSLSYVTDSSNETDAFLRNRLRHHVMPLLKRENPRLAENVSAMALRLREDEKTLSQSIDPERWADVSYLRQASAAQRSRMLSAFLESCGVREPAAEHIALAEALVFSEKPSAKASFPGGVTVLRNYGTLEKQADMQEFSAVHLPTPGAVELPAQNLRVLCTPCNAHCAEKDCFTVCPTGRIWIRPRQPGDTMRLSGGTKKLKELFIDAKIPAARRLQIPVIADDGGVLGVYGFGPNHARLTREEPGVQIRFEKIR